MSKQYMTSRYDLLTCFLYLEKIYIMKILCSNEIIMRINISGLRDDKKDAHEYHVFMCCTLFTIYYNEQLLRVLLNILNNCFFVVNFLLQLNWMCITIALLLV